MKDLTVRISEAIIRAVGQCECKFETHRDPESGNPYVRLLIEMDEPPETGEARQQVRGKIREAMRQFRNEIAATGLEISPQLT
jgi:hypothetical protein